MSPDYVRTGRVFREERWSSAHHLVYLRHVCQGYVPTPASSSGLSSFSSKTSRPKCAVVEGQPPVDDSTENETAQLPQIGEKALLNRPFSRFDNVTTGFSSSLPIPKAGHPLVMDPSLMTPRAISLIPPGVVDPSDRATVELYFSRHPWELVMSSEFVSEMNANVLAVLQQNPQATVDSLSAIGHSYIADSPLAVLNYRARILSTLRSMELSEYSLEEMLLMLLGLCAVELVDCKPNNNPETTIPAIIANSAALLSHWVSTGREVSSLARYFIRALARQDMIISLFHLRRLSIPTEVWLDETARTTADRLMGYTTTLMPLLGELCELAEDMRGLLQAGPVESQQQQQQQQQHEGEDEDEDELETSQLMLDISSHMNSSNGTSYYDFDLESPHHLVDFADYMQRAEDLRRRIELWKPTLAHGLSFRRSRRFLSQAACYRAGALLYLFRLLNPPHPYNNNSTNINTNNNEPPPPPPSSFSSSSIVDEEATAKAHEILMSTVAAAHSPDEVKMLLWPVFLAACELSKEEDRQAVLDVFDAIMSQRKTATVQRSRAFILNRVWPARDEGREWNWMVLAQQYPSECLPI
ncbi:hypothetical protein M406DRAFT_70291 [Cryphonectria parasitica EP155]|uniref:Uncharacterized protein n=1 Tax=Cryphonectria parasitica (strain ATCC 38755 / EP155) TaxID=660469 RepID=A0A9P5CNJ9_CRYP1|nr:uncharacterized protein M406DRAFT_70291 [Cryphonectria parasitica EP155]KAF3765213.1 hypothetical protein M406DRAFT_70291 [Cryphonectria parasitica EP155]